MNDQHLSLIKSLPHSYPFVLIDRVLEFIEGKRAVCQKNITVNDVLLQGHCGDNHIFPAVFILEAMAQTSGLLIRGEGTEGTYLSMIRDAGFNRPVIPGDELVITSSIFYKLPPLYVFEVKASVRDEIVSEAEITLALV